MTLDDLEGPEVKVVVFGVKCVKHGKNILADLKRLKVKVTNGPVTTIGM